MENRDLILIAASVLFVFPAYQELRRKNRSRLLLRLFAVLAAICGLVFMILPLTYTISRSRGTVMVLLSSGSTSQKLPEGPYFTTDSNVLAAYPHQHITYIPDLALYLQLHPDIRQLKVYGYGLKPEELGRLGEVKADFVAAASPAGITAVSWPAVISQTTMLQVQGTYHNPSTAPVKLLWRGLGATVDSVIISPNRKASFLLSTQPKQIGSAVYTLLAVQGKDTLEKEPIPFTVTAQPKLKLLVLSSFPDFEYKFLKNWLFDHQFEVVFRTRISRDKFSVDQLNTSAVNTSSLSAAALAKFDLVIADDEELSKTDAAILNTAITKGLGLVIRITDRKMASAFAKKFAIYGSADSSQEFYIRPGAGERILKNDPAGKVLLSSLLMGNGKITASAVPSTYHWVLAGKQKEYSNFWSELISKTARTKEDPDSWKTIPALPVVDQQTYLLNETGTTDSIPQISINGQRLNPLQHISLPFRWQSTFWPAHTGWNTISAAETRITQFYVYSAQDWKAIQAEEQLSLNLAAFKIPVIRDTPPKSTSVTTEKEVSKWWFFTLFLAALTFLWLEAKLL